MKIIMNQYFIMIGIAEKYLMLIKKELEFIIEKPKISNQIFLLI